MHKNLTKLHHGLFAMVLSCFTFPAPALAQELEDYASLLADYAALVVRFEVLGLRRFSRVGRFQDTVFTYRRTRCRNMGPSR